jgi:hypothetical protein
VAAKAYVDLKRHLTTSSLPPPSLSPPSTANMQAIKLQRKYPEVSQEDMFDLINRFKCVLPRTKRRSAC